MTCSYLISFSHIIRPPPNNFNDFNGDRVPANAWRPMSAAEQGPTSVAEQGPPPLNAGQFSRPNDVGISQNSVRSFTLLFLVSFCSFHKYTNLGGKR